MGRRYEDILFDLLENFFYSEVDGAVFFSYKEYTSIRDISPELNDECLAILRSRNG